MTVFLRSTPGKIELKITRAIASFAFFFVLFSLAFADYPDKPIRFVVGYPPGGATDIIARTLGIKLTDSLGQQVLIDNRPGAGGIIGTDIVAKAIPDGHTIVLVTTSHGVNPSLYGKLPYDTVKSFAPVTQVASLQVVLVVNPSLQVKSVKELIALAKSKPGQLNFASSGSGQSLHLSGELFKTMAGIDIVHIPYKGSAPARTDLLGGQVQMMFESMIAVLPFVTSGKLRALAVGGARRSPAAPDIPTMAEAALPGFESSGWVGVLAPAGTPKAVISRLNTETVKVLKMPDVNERFSSNGAESVGSSPEQFGEFIKSALNKWAKVVKISGARID
ncbi:MAG: tripartite tricarboxylate transporter substrate binding protein [Betaproteobacteria bacterium]|nr:tripartite tricarboxylate transporter substrate binding protein [Betaproteobacteria bacterium]